MAGIFGSIDDDDGSVVVVMPRFFSVSPF